MKSKTALMRKDLTTSGTCSLCGSDLKVLRCDFTDLRCDFKIFRFCAQQHHGTQTQTRHHKQDRSLIQRHTVGGGRIVLIAPFTMVMAVILALIIIVLPLAILILAIPKQRMKDVTEDAGMALFRNQEQRQ